MPGAKRLAGLRARREQVEASVRELADEAAEVARELQRQGYSLRDIAELIGTSHQRVQQWVAQGQTRPRKRARRVAQAAAGRREATAKAWSRAALRLAGLGRREDLGLEVTVEAA